MELTIKQKAENKSLGRQQLTCELTYDKAMPSRKEIREAICAATGADASLLVIVSAKGGFGSNKAAVLANLYNNKQAFTLEQKHLLVRDGLIEKPKAVAKAAAKKKK
ncbi:MAG: hypothetical protein NT051_04535 [Candidatus Micrarchaeota archaeon]|nr:hypothetical protein [Candidatus Micrarchaeota archaeon]